jgi:hypothetical protein
MSKLGSLRLTRSALTKIEASKKEKSFVRDSQKREKVTVDFNPTDGNTSPRPLFHERLTFTLGKRNHGKAISYKICDNR